MVRVDLFSIRAPCSNYRNSENGHMSKLSLSMMEHGNFVTSDLSEGYCSFNGSNIQTRFHLYWDMLAVSKNWQRFHLSGATIFHNLPIRMPMPSWLLVTNLILFFGDIQWVGLIWKLLLPTVIVTIPIHHHVQQYHVWSCCCNTYRTVDR